MRCLLLFLFFGVGITALFAQEQGSLRGVVKDQDGATLPGALVFINELQMGASTNAEGLFSIAKIPYGTHELKVAYPAKDTLVYEFTQSEKVQQVTLVLRDQVTTQIIEILGQGEGEIDRNQVDVGITKITPEEINLIPSLSADLVNALTVQPGVVSTGDQGGQLYIRGGTSVQNLLLFDGAVMYNPFHSIGVFSVFDADYLQSVDVYSGGFPADFGGRVSSVLDVKTRPGNFRKFSGKISGNPIMSTALLEGPLWNKKEGAEQSGGSYLFSYRGMYLNNTADVFYPYVNDSAGLPFSFNDFYGKLTFGNGANYASLFGFFQNDQVNYEFPNDLNWSQYGGGLNFQFLPNNSQIILSGSIGWSRFVNELDNPDEFVPRNSSIGGFNGRFNFSYILNSADELRYGLQILGFSNDLTLTNSVGLQTDDQSSNTEFVLYSSYKKVFRKKEISPTGNVSFFTRALIEPGLRVHYYNDQGRVQFEPRLRAKLNFKRWSIQGSAGLFSQNIMTAVSDRDVVQLFQAYLAVPRVELANQQFDQTLQRAWHALGGVQFQLLPGLTSEVEGWYKGFQQVVNINRERLFPEDPNFIAEEGRAFGADVILKYQRNKLYLYGTYGYAKNFRNDGAREYAPVYDRRHNLNLVGSYRLGALVNEKRGSFLAAKWEFSVRYQLGTGFPFTQTQGFFEQLDFNDGSNDDYITQNGNLGLLLSDDLNGGRLPDYHRLDLGAKRRWTFGGSTLLELSATVINTYNRANVFYFDRVRNARVDQLPIIPTVGVQFKW